jgi:hypothetical protein
VPRRDWRYRDPSVAIVAVDVLERHHPSMSAIIAAGTEHIGCPFLELRLPGCDPIGVDVELLRKLSKGSVVASRAQAPGLVMATPHLAERRAKLINRRDDRAASARLARN